MSLALGSGVPNPLHCIARPLGKGPSMADLWIGFAPRKPGGPRRQLCRQWLGGLR